MPGTGRSPLPCHRSDSLDCRSDQAACNSSQPDMPHYQFREASRKEPPARSPAEPAAWSDGQWTDQGMAGLGKPPVDDPVKAQAAEVRTVRKTPGPGRGDRVVAGDQCVDVVHQYATRELHRVLVVVPRSLGSVTWRSVAVVDIVRRDDLGEPLRVAAVGGEIGPDRIFWRHGSCSFRRRTGLRSTYRARHPR